MASPAPRKTLPALPGGKRPARSGSRDSARSASREREKAPAKEEKAKRRVGTSDVVEAQRAMNEYSADGERYRLKKLIGKGAYGAVYVAEAPDGRKVAVKHIINAFTGSTDARRIFREIRIMSHFDHPNLVPLLEILRPRDTDTFTGMYLVVELMETDLHRVIHSRQDLTSDHISYFLYQILCALKHLHSAGVLHRDLKPSNLLVNADCQVRVCDFGLAREAEATLSTALTEYVVTRWYRAPEVLLSGGKYSGAIDIWSVGCILAELLLRKPLFPGESYLHQLQLVIQTLGTPPPAELSFVRLQAARDFLDRQPHSDGIAFSTLFPHVRGPCLDLLEQMLQFNPDRRISVDDALAHPFLARVRAARRSITEFDCPDRFVIGYHLRHMSIAEIRHEFVDIYCRDKAPAASASASAGMDASPGAAAGGGGSSGDDRVDVSDRGMAGADSSVPTPGAARMDAGGDGATGASSAAAEYLRKTATAAHTSDAVPSPGEGADEEDADGEDDEFYDAVGESDARFENGHDEGIDDEATERYWEDAQQQLRSVLTEARERARRREMEHAESRPADAVDPRSDYETRRRAALNSYSYYGGTADRDEEHETDAPVMLPEDMPEAVGAPKRRPRDGLAVDAAADSEAAYFVSPSGGGMDFGH